MTQWLGWEPIWNSPKVPKRFDSFSAPNNTLVEWAATLPPGASLFDLGCGMGRHAVYLGGRGFRVAGSDISPTGVQRTIEACAQRGITFDGKVCNMTVLPWPDAVFDAAFSTSTIHHVLRDDIKRAIGEVWRILKPGGLFMVDFPSTHTLDYERLLAEVTAGHLIEPEPNTFIDERLDSEDIDGYLPHHFCDETDLRDLMSKFTILHLWEALHPARPQRGPGMVGKWVVWAQKSL